MILSLIIDLIQYPLALSINIIINIHIFVGQKSIQLVYGSFLVYVELLLNF